MGGAISSNTAKAIASVTNKVENSTTANTAQVSEQLNQTSFKGCHLTATKNIDVNQAQETLAKNIQMVTGISSTSVRNNLQQKMMQQAQSTVGSMGIGIASATNSASMMANAASDVSNTVSANAAQYAGQVNDFSCTDTWFKAANISIGQGSVSSNLSNQAVKSENVTQLATSISQKAVQKATAKVAGLASFLIALALVIVAIGWSIGKTLTAGGATKILVIVALVIGMGILAGFMYMWKTPPFFDDPVTCKPGKKSEKCDITGKNCFNCEECIDIKNTKIDLNHPPIKYLFSIYEEPPANSPIRGTLLGMVVSATATDDETKYNGGYNMEVKQSLDTKSGNLQDEMKKDGVSVPNDIPAILVSSDPNDPDGNGFDIPGEFWPASQDDNANAAICTPQTIQHDKNAKSYNPPTQNIDCTSQLSVNLSAKSNKTPLKQVANLNTEGWKTFCNNSPQNIGFARLFLLRLWSMAADGFNPDLSFYQTKNDIIRYMVDDTGKYGVVKDIKKDNPNANIFQYMNAVNNAPFAGALSGSGHIQGPVGVCNNREYQLRQIARSIGIWILVGVIVLIMLIMFVPMLFQRKGQTAVPNTE
jgi:F0F1-type ATP synthase assembly protein I